MSVEPRRVAKTEVWTDWEGRIVNGLFPLRRFLGGSNHSAVFLTEYKAENLPDAAIKFVPADTSEAQAQLVQWGTAATLSHPHLLRLFDVGRCQFGGRAFLFVVMDYAEQTLAQVLPKRPLTPDEAWDLLLPTLDALAFLHRNSLVHSRLKPSNFLVVNDKLTLASDTIRPIAPALPGSAAIGNAASGFVRGSLYDPPELKDGRLSPASDVWDLGMTLVEALTQRTPTWPDDRVEWPSLPTTLPPAFVDTLRRCLSRTPAKRSTVKELEARYRLASAGTVTSVSSSPAVEARHEPTAPQHLAEPSSERSRIVPALAVAAVALIGVATFVGWRHFQGRSNSQHAAPRISFRVAAGDAGTFEGTDRPMAEPTTPASAVSLLNSAPTNQAPPLAPPVVATPDRLPSAEPPAAATVDRSRSVAPLASTRPAAPPSVAPLASTRPAAPPSVAPLASTRPADSPAVEPPAAVRLARLPGHTQPIASTSAAHRASVTPATVTAASDINPSGLTSPAPTQPSLPLPPASSAVHEEIPEVPPAIRDRIHGHVRVTVRALVDPAGNVVGEFMENAGPSRYFAGLAADAAGKWKFIPTDNRNSRVWLLRFEFTRDTTTISATTAQ